MQRTAPNGRMAWLPLLRGCERHSAMCDCATLSTDLAMPIISRNSFESARILARPAKLSYIITSPIVRYTPHCVAVCGAWSSPDDWQARGMLFSERRACAASGGPVERSCTLPGLSLQFITTVACCGCASAPPLRSIVAPLASLRYSIIVVCDSDDKSLRIERPRALCNQGYTYFV